MNQLKILIILGCLIGFPDFYQPYYNQYYGPNQYRYWTQEPYSYGPSGCAAGFYWNGQECWPY